MNDTQSTWTLGVLVGLPIAVLATLLLLIVAVCALIYGIRNRTAGKQYQYIGGWERWSDRRRGFTLLPVPVVLIVVLWTILGFGYWPYSAEYHQYRPVSGTVQSVASRLAGSANASTDQVYVLTLTGSARRYAVSDTRMALVKAGDGIRLRCIRGYDYGSNDAGYYCKWGK